MDSTALERAVRLASMGCRAGSRTLERRLDWGEDFAVDLDEADETSAAKAVPPEMTGFPVRSAYWSEIDLDVNQR